MIGASNTIINNDGILHAENTDWMSVKDMLESKQVKNLTILGNGGYADAVKYACKLLDITTTSITRSNWQEIESLKDITVFNCTPVENIAIHESIDFINCLTWTETGAALASAQSKYQFKIYTGKVHRLIADLYNILIIIIMINNKQKQKEFIQSVDSFNF